MKVFLHVRKLWNVFPLEKKCRFSMAMGKMGLTRDVCLFTCLVISALGGLLFVWGESKYWPSMYLLLEGKLGISIGTMYLTMAAIVGGLTMVLQPYSGEYSSVEFVRARRCAVHLPCMQFGSVLTPAERLSILTAFISEIRELRKTLVAAGVNELEFVSPLFHDMPTESLMVLARGVARRLNGHHVLVTDSEQSNSRLALVQGKYLIRFLVDFSVYLITEARKSFGVNELPLLQRPVLLIANRKERGFVITFR